MFRQKIAQVTDCSCRLISGQASQYQIFKTPNSHLKPITKEPKEKYSLKTQTTSSSKHQNKTTSAQKICLKPLKASEQQKISISANLDAKRQKLQKNLICSPENSNVRKLDQKVIFATNSNSNQSYFTKIPNGVKTAQVNRKIDKRIILNSHNQLLPQQVDKLNIQLNNFITQKPLQNQKDLYSQLIEVPKKSLNFEEYYKYVSNPYSVSQKNKENIHMGENSQISKYKMDLKMKKEMRKIKNQTLPLQEIEFIPQTQVFHESLEKYESGNQKQSRGTHNGSMATKNSQNCQSDSIKTSKNEQISLMNSKVTNFDENTLEYQKVLDQGNTLRQNKSLVVLTQKNPNIGSYRHSRKDIKSHLITDYESNQQSSFRSQLSQTHRPVSSIQNSQVRNFFKPLENLSGLSSVKPQESLVFEGINKKQPPNQRIFIEKINTLNDIMNNSVQCESLMGEGEENCSENQESVVIMRYQDLLEETQHKAQTQGSQFWLQPQHLLMNEKNLEKTGNKNLLDSTKISTNVKPCGPQFYHPVGDSSISTNPYLKQTVKVNKEYLTNNFSHAE